MTITTVIVPDHSHLTQLDDAALLALQADIAASRRQLDAAAASVAGEVVRRSSRELGYDGLAQRVGARTPEKLIQHVTGLTAPEARALARVGEALDTGSPWHDPVIRAVTEGDLSIAAANAIVTGLGSPTAEVAADDLTDAADRLVRAAAETTPERIAAAARAIRDELDTASVADREATLRARRFLRLIPEPDGMTRIIGRLDPESAAIVTAALDRITAPRRGGPRFVDPREVARADRIVADERTTEQLTADALVDIVRVASAADDGTVFGVRAPEVQVHVHLSDLEAGVGSAEIDGQTAHVSIATAQRMVCTAGMLPILFDGSRVLDVGRAQRLFTPAQRIALAARDRGCMWPGCDRPPSWTEAHHTKHWHRDDGRTDLKDGVLLCRHHHMLVHNNGWEIERDDNDRYWLVPPETVDPTQTRRLMGRWAPGASTAGGGVTSARR